MTTIEFINGAMDGKILDVENLSPKIIFPVFPKKLEWVTDPRGEERVLLLQTVYKRISDTNTYICVSEPL